MKTQIIFVALALVLGFADAYSKYGRSCTDIGCRSNEECVMAEDPCYSRDQPCGMYPTCRKLSNSVSNCQTFVCPSTTVCIVDGGVPKCVDDKSPAAANAGNSKESLAPSAPLYPQIPPRGQTTTRPHVNRGGAPAGNGYQGGSIGSGYPGQSNGGYPGQPNSGYPGQPNSGYPGQPNSGYPGQPNSGYPGQPYSGYPGQPNSGYPGQPNSGYPGQSNYPSYPSNNGYNNGYNPYGSNPYGTRPFGSGASSTTTNPLYDTLKGTLKTIGLFCIVVHALVARINGY